MAGHSYSDQASRLVVLSGEFIAHAIPTEVLGNCGKQMDMPRNKTDTVVFASWVPYGATVSNPNTWTISAAAHVTTEGVTPKADTMVRRDVPITLQQYSCLYAFTDKDFNLYEDDLVAGFKEQVGRRMGIVREMAIYGQMKASTNKFYAGALASTRATVSGKVTDILLQRMVRSLNANHAKKITKVLGPSNDFGTRSVEAAFVAYCHTDLEQDIRALPGFIVTSNYGVRQVLNEFELGTWMNIRFVLSQELYSYADAATSVTASTYGLKTTTGTNPDVFPLILMGEEAFGQVKLRGVDAVKPIYLPVDSQDKSDPLNQRGYIGANFWFGSGILNPGWLIVAEVAASDLLG